MRFKKYENMKDFMNENFELILQKEWLNNLMVGNCLDGLDTGTEGWILGRVEDDNQVQLIMLYRKPWKILLYSPTDNKSDELYKFVAEEICKIDNELIGVNAEREIAEKFAKYYSEVSNTKIIMDTPMRILVLEEINEGKLLDNVLMRDANFNDREKLIKFVDEFHREALKESLSREMIEEKVDRYLERGYFLWEEDGKIVSQAVFSRKLEKGASIGGVYTPKELRGKGYAYNLVYQLSKRCLEKGYDYCVLYTDDGNPISNHIYEKIGYKRRADCFNIKFDKGR